MSVSDITPAHMVKKHPISEAIGRAVYSTRWGLAPLFLLLWVAVAAYVYKFVQYLWLELIVPINHLDIEELMLRVVNLVDMGMVASLVVVIAIGSFSTFVREYDLSVLPSPPRWMKGLTSMTLKIKMGVSLIGVSSVHLLTTFMRADEVSTRRVIIEMSIHMMYVVTTIGFCIIDKMLHANEGGHAPTTLETHH